MDELSTAGFELNAKKWEIRVSRLILFRYDLGEKGVALSEEKVTACVNAGAPKDAEEDRSFLGLVQY